MALHSFCKLLGLAFLMVVTATATPTSSSIIMSSSSSPCPSPLATRRLSKWAGGTIMYPIPTGHSKSSQRNVSSYSSGTIFNLYRTSGTQSKSQNSTSAATFKTKLLKTSTTPAPTFPEATRICKTTTGTWVPENTPTSVPKSDQSHIMGVINTISGNINATNPLKIQKQGDIHNLGWWYYTPAKTPPKGDSAYYDFGVKWSEDPA